MCRAALKISLASKLLKEVSIVRHAELFVLSADIAYREKTERY